VETVRRIRKISCNLYEEFTGEVLNHDGKCREMWRGVEEMDGGREGGEYIA
jgi:hypothetical protein